MSRDIHMTIEFRNDGEAWQSVKKPVYLSNNHYFVFDILAAAGRDSLAYVVAEAVKQDKEATLRALKELSAEIQRERFSFEPRGLPQDLTSRARYRYRRYGSDAHTPSWLSYEEMETFFTIYTKFPVYEFLTNRKTIFKKWCKTAKEFGIEHPRAVALLNDSMEQGLRTNRTNKHVSIMMRRLRYYKKKYDEVRVVFFFDN